MLGQDVQRSSYRRRKHCRIGEEERWSNNLTELNSKEEQHLEAGMVVKKREMGILGIMQRMIISASYHPYDNDKRN